MIDEPQGTLTCWSSTLIVLADSGLFCGPEAISMVVEPQGALTCWSSTLIALADSGPFHGLLLIVLVSRSDFHD